MNIAPPPFPSEPNALVLVNEDLIMSVSIPSMNTAPPEYDAFESYMVEFEMTAWLPET